MANRPDVSFGMHLVAYLDLLGQAAELDRIRTVPTTDAEKQEVAKIINRSALRVYEIRSYFYKFRDDLTTKRDTPEVVKRLPAAAQEAFERSRYPTLRQIGFSDTFVVSVPVGRHYPSDHAFRSLNSVWVALVAIGGVSLLAASRGIPLRGGVTVGTGVDIFENEVYGPALLDAYRLESEVAQYPRVVVGAALLDDLLAAANNPNPPDAMVTDLAKRCLGLICRSPDDSLPMINPLSSSVLNLPTDNGGTWNELWPLASSWAHSEANRFAAERNYKLWPRYERLARYYDAYAPKQPPTEPTTPAEEKGGSS